MDLTLLRKDEGGWEEPRRRKGKSIVGYNPNEGQGNPKREEEVGGFKHSFWEGGISNRNSEGCNLKPKFMVAKDAQKSTYCEAIKGDLNQVSAKLEFVEPSIENGKIKGWISLNVIGEAQGRWNNCLILYVEGNRSHFKVLKLTQKGCGKLKRDLRCKLGTMASLWFDSNKETTEKNLG